MRKIGNSAQRFGNTVFGGKDYFRKQFPCQSALAWHAEFGGKVVFYISYKNTQEDLDRCINSAKQLVALMDSLGKGASIQKMMPYENW
jgi:hypothetical protein